HHLRLNPCAAHVPPAIPRARRRSGIAGSPARDHRRSTIGGQSAAPSRPANLRPAPPATRQSRASVHILAWGQLLWSAMRSPTPPRPHAPAAGPPCGPAPSLATLARGEGWRVIDYTCHAGPQDAPFEEQHEEMSIAAVLAGSFHYRASSGQA